MKGNNYIKNTVFFIVLIVMCFLYNYHEILFSGPYSTHLWRQADCLSITKNYCEDNLSFFEPEVHWIGDKGHGRTISEFPIIYYTVAQLWKIFGQKEFLFRLINILIVFSGLFSLFKLSKQILEDTFWSYFIPIFLFTSPLLIFYTNNFLANTPAFGLALTGTYFYYKHWEEKSNKLLIYSMITFTLAGLIKITSLIIFIAILAVIFLNGLNKLIRKENTFKGLFRQLSPFFIVGSLIFIWYGYACYYNSINHKNLFLQEIFPIWELSPEKRKETFNLFYKNLLPAYFNKKVLLGIFTLYLFSFFHYKSINKKLFSILIITSIGIILYGILWFRALHVHDYYLTNLLIFIPLVLIAFLEYFKNKWPGIYKNYIVKGLITGLVLGLIGQGALINRLKYNTKEYSPICKYFINKETRDYWSWVHWDYKNEKLAFETVEPYLRSLGISRTDKVLSMSDWSINITLYFMDQKGLTKYGFSWLDDNQRIEFAKEQGCKYMIISDKDLKKTEIRDKYLQHQIGKHKNLSIFKLGTLINETL